MHITTRQSIFALSVTAVVFYVICKMNEEIFFLKNALEKERRINYESAKYNTIETKNLLYIADMGVGMILSLIIVCIIFEFKMPVIEKEESAKGISEIYFDTEMALVKGLSTLQLKEKKMIPSGTPDSGVESINEESLPVETNTDPLMKIPPEKINQSNPLQMVTQCTEEHPYEEYMQCYAIGKLQK